MESMSVPTLPSVAHWSPIYANLVYTISFLFLSLATTYLLTTLRSSLALSPKTKSRNGASPPIVPYSIPLLGNLIPFATNTQAFMTYMRCKFGNDLPARVKIGTRNIFYISGPLSILTLFRRSRELSTAASVIMVMENAFGAPRSGRSLYERDNTGVFGTPVEGSNEVEQKDRYWHIGHKLLHAGLQGPALDGLSKRFLKNLESELEAQGRDGEWIEFEDFYQVVRQAGFKASTTTLCGPHIFKLTPDFGKLFWDFDFHITKLFKGIPRWLAPNSYHARDRYVAAVKKWNTFALENAPSDLGNLEWEEFHGAKLMRDRAIEIGGIKGMTSDGMASENAGMLWGANANIVPAIAWCLIDVLLRPTLYSRVQQEIASSRDTSTLLSSPLLQSLYTEELRLRGSVGIQRTPIVPTFQLGNRTMPQGDLILASSWHEQHAVEIWNQSPTLRDPVPHPITEFWAERFLLYPDDPSTGPRKPSSEKIDEKARTVEKTEPKFTIAPVNGSYLPFGGGQNICPGRFYAKYEAIGGLATFLTMFEIELDVALEDVRMDMSYFSFGVIPPKNKFPGRMRRVKV